ncbi:unnamed protein product [Microthlaspi erraticum]|uniref:Uncharacterized protein n=1 Tax=Microthlaspi erraticum TaxID=1685480 RepID=A0A6D2IJU1_9BRAS|nr:unnamed protein product [Microthlaspi erraticum]
MSKAPCKDKIRLLQKGNVLSGFLIARGSVESAKKKASQEQEVLNGYSVQMGYNLMVRDCIQIWFEAGCYSQERTAGFSITELQVSGSFRKRAQGCFEMELLK